MKIWFVFCGLIELLVYCIADYYGYNILLFELIKIVFYVLSCIVLNFIMIRKNRQEDYKICMNAGVSASLSSFMGALSVILFLKAEKKIAWIGFLIIYIGTLMLTFYLWKNSKATENKTNIDEKRWKGGYLIGFLTMLGFIRTASEQNIISFFEMALLFMIWLYMFISIIFYVRCKDDFNKNRLSKTWIQGDCNGGKKDFGKGTESQS